MIKIKDNWGLFLQNIEDFKCLVNKADTFLYKTRKLSPALKNQLFSKYINEFTLKLKKYLNRGYNSLLYN